MIALVTATDRGRAMAERLAASLPEAKLFDGPAAQALPAAWADPAVEQIVAFLAVGAAVRLVAPALDDKHSDPGLVCVDDGGRWAVAVLGGHHGANATAVEVGRLLGAQPVVTSASDSIAVPSLEELGRDAGLRHDPQPDDAAVAGALVAGRRVLLVADHPWPLGPLPPWVEPAAAEEAGVPAIVVSDRELGPPAGARAVLRPPTLVLGVGAASEAPDLSAAAAEAMEGWSPLSLRAVATLDRKREQAESLGLAPVVAFGADELAEVDVPTPSATVAAAVGTPSVAEAAALLAAGAGAELVRTKVVMPSATAALARVAPRGEVRVIGCGPGDVDHMTVAARQALAGCHVVIGLTGYVEGIRPLLHAAQRVEASPIGEEMGRVGRAVALAEAGWTVGLLGSGDAGVYGLAGPLLEAASPDLAVELFSGVTAALSAAALLGAPLTHDHCAISLSDLLTPWETIERRLEAAAGADFVVALYNPRSRRRTRQLSSAREILLRHRPGSTPVGVVTDAHRPGQRVEITTLDGLDEASVGMTTVVVVGSTTTRVVGHRMVTPRGYPT